MESATTTTPTVVAAVSPPRFDDLVISTRTVVVSSNTTLDVTAISEWFVPYAAAFAGDGAVHRTMVLQGMTVALTDIYYKKSFRNALNVVYRIHDADMCADRRVNIKVHKNGKFQLTGCKKMRYAQICLWHFLELIHAALPAAIICDGDIQLFFQTVMTNVDFNLGFMVNRRELDLLMNTATDYYSLLETSFGYTGVNIKFPLNMKWWETPCPAMRWTLGTQGEIKYALAPLHSFVPETAIERLRRKGKFNTFLVFHSGKVIMSGMFTTTMREDYDIFLAMIQKWRPRIEQRMLA